MTLLSTGQSCYQPCAAPEGDTCYANAKKQNNKKAHGCARALLYKDREPADPSLILSFYLSFSLPIAWEDKSHPTGSLIRGSGDSQKQGLAGQHHPAR